MPCAAPCNRLPCNQRCQKILSCGHQCPGLCGERCHEQYCQTCSSRLEDRVDLLEFKSYKDINLDESPIVVLGCGHFFTAESLDGLARLGDVYTTDASGEFNGLRDIPDFLNIPCCPDCKRPIRQFVTQRYNRVINKAVMDETAKRFFAKGMTELDKLEKQSQAVAVSLENTRGSVVARHTGRLLWRSDPLQTTFSERYAEIKCLERSAIRFCKEMGTEEQPQKKLHDATLRATSEQAQDGRVENSKSPALPKPLLDKQVMIRGRMIQIQLQNTLLHDQLNVLSRVSLDDSTSLCSDIKLDKQAVTFLHHCQKLIKDSVDSNLPKFAIRASIAYSRVAKCFEYFQRHHSNRSPDATPHVDAAPDLLKQASEMCRGFDGAGQLQVEIEKSLRLFEERYKATTPEEIEMIKVAMVSGSESISTHSGHWYKCSQGHIVSLLNTLSPTCVEYRICLLGKPLVCDRRVRYADGACSLPRMRSDYRRTESQFGGRC